MKYLGLFICSLLVVTIAKADVIDERSGIIISSTKNEHTFPDYWMGGDVNAQAVELDSLDLARSIEAVKCALAKYPVALLEKNLKTVYVFKSITFFGQAYGGTCSTEDVYLANMGALKGYTDHYLEQAFHHEFSSILWTNYKSLFNEEVWANENGMPYGESGLQAIIGGESSVKPDSIYYANGFLFQYAQSSLENDINSFAENIFSPKEWFENVVNLYSVLAKKYELILKFYAAIDDQFTRSFFENIANEMSKTIDYKTGMRIK